MTATHLSQAEHEGLPVIVGFKNGFTSVATRHHVVDRAAILETVWPDDGLDYTLMLQELRRM